MFVRYLSRTACDGLISAIYESRLANGNAQENSLAQNSDLQRGIETMSMTFQFLGVFSGPVFSSQTVIYVSPYAEEVPQTAPMGRSRSLRGSGCTGIFDSDVLSYGMVHASLCPDVMHEETGF